MGVPAGSSGLVSLDDVKAHLNENGTAHDVELQGFIDGVTPIVQAFTGPITPATFDEWYDGGHPVIQARHRPIVSITSVTEYLGPTAYPLAVVATPDVGSMYSFSWEPTGKIVRRTAGGGTQPFAGGYGSVHIIYTAGFVVVPGNVRLGTLELIRENYQPTQQAARPGYGRAGNSDDTINTATGTMMGGYFVSPRVAGILQPNRRAPAVA